MRMLPRGRGSGNGRGSIARAGHPQGFDGDVREERKGTTAPLDHLPGKFASITCTEAERKGGSKMSVPESTFLFAFGVLWATFHWEAAAGGCAGKEPTAGGI